MEKFKFDRNSAGSLDIYDNDIHTQKLKDSQRILGY